MIVFVNGAFGVGKSTVAELLAARLPNSHLYDAELVGYFLRAVVPKEALTGDFQDLPMWRMLTVATARLLREQYGRTLIMPMTIWYRPYFDEVLGGLRDDDPAVYHFTLTATAETLRARLLGRGDRPETFAWCWERAQHCLAAFPGPAFATHLPTDGKTPAELAEAILAQLPPLA